MGIVLRSLELKDAKYMHEWMQDDSVVHYLNKDFGKMTIKDCERFIVDGATSNTDYHQAIVNDENDEYLGTVSLKNIDRETRIAEFGITVRTCAMGTGAAYEAMCLIMRTGFAEFDLEDIYWYVNQDNVRALKFYDKHGFRRWQFDDVRRKLLPYYKENSHYIWFIEDKADSYATGRIK
ncbi:MAG: GNAT family N-acetyltransferase [Butyrivibrio sp.]|jgi:diamine N-acetyltransferase|nr:GNAT family N-acetyltransferase [Butyrivibrio sp.]